MSKLTPVPITPPPGVIKTDAVRAIEGRYCDADMMRFVGTKPEKIGGWVRQTDTPTSGAARTLHAWRDNSFLSYIGAGTYQRLYVIDRAFDLHNVTPTSQTGTLTNPFTTSAGSTSVEVAHSGHDRTVGSVVSFAGATVVGGIVIDGEYTVAAIAAASYTITAAAAAASGATGGGTVSYQYEIPIGNAVSGFLLGWGTGGWGSGTWGTRRSSSATQVIDEPRIWSLDHLGQYLIATYNTGKLYYWDPTAVPAYERATLIAQAPTNIRAAFVTSQRFIVALCDDMTIRWPDQEDFLLWTPADDNTANVRPVTLGTKLIAGRELGGNVSLIWTDAGLYEHQYTGSELVFDTRPKGKNCGLVSPNGAIIVGGTAYWMGQRNFFQYSGSVMPMPNVEDIRAYVFDNLNPDLGYLCAAMYVPQFNEVWFFYVEQGTTNPGLYVIYSIGDQCWTPGTLTRVAGTFFEYGETRPYLADENGYIYLHEDGNDADDAAIDAYLTLAPSGLQHGATKIRIHGFEPDLLEQSGKVTLTLKAYDRVRKLTDTPIDTDELTILPDESVTNSAGLGHVGFAPLGSRALGEGGTPLQPTEGYGFLDPRISGRYIGMTIRSNTLGGYFRLGTPTAYIRPAGTRP